MTLPRVSLGSDAAQRAVDLILAVEELTTRDALSPDAPSPDAPSPDAGSADGRGPGCQRAHLAAVTEVFDQWHDRPDAELGHQIGQVLDVIADLARLVDITDVGLAAHAVNDLFERFAGPPRLVHEPDWGWHVHVDRSDAGWGDWLAASSAMGFAELLVHAEHVPWGRCAARGCHRPFLDHGRREPQRFCTGTCATRERVRRHRTVG